MKIRRSLKIYFFCAGLCLGSITVLSFSTLAANYFFQGMDIALKYTMIEMARNIDVNDGEPKSFLGFHMSNRWQDMPIEVIESLPEPEGYRVLEKYADETGWFTAPNFAMFALKYEKPDGRIVYVSRILADIKANHDDTDLPHTLRLVFYAIIAILSSSLIILLILHHVAKPVERLMIWAKGLNSEKLTQPVPDFEYSELNKLADILKSSLYTAQDSLEREKKFLSHASHELRTPIAVVRSNTELMIKLQQREGTEEKQREVLDRILRAGVTMTDLCETLLWLNRGGDVEPPTRDADLSGLVQAVAQELHYLLHNKQIELNVETNAETFHLPVTLCRVVIANLIRNAYQHTYCGRVTIKQLGTKVTIINENEHPTEGRDNLGFGLGLELTERIISHYHWQYSVVEHSNGREVSIDLTQKK
jgi:signal transduction histidine kinase